MDKRVFKRLVILSIFISILTLLSLGIYFSQRLVPSCVDGIKNQKEEGIDCGGPCPPCELVYAQNPVLLWIKIFSPQEGVYDLVVKIKNPNQNYGSGEVPYQLGLYDSKGGLIKLLKGTTFILPNQTKYLVLNRIKSEQIVKKAILSFGEIHWQELKNLTSELFIKGKKYYLISDSDKAGFSQARGVVVNHSNFDFDKVGINILLFDDSHRLLSAQNTEIRTLLAGQEREFIVTWFNPIEGKVASVEMEAETNLFDLDNYLSTPPSELEKFQEY